MKKVLIASVGGSLELLVSAIVHHQPAFVYFLCSTGKSGSDALVPQIVPSAKLAEGSFAVERVQSPHDLRDVTAACARIEADLAERFAGEELEVVANYSGGTRTMSTGLGALALRRGWEAEVTERPVRPWCGPVSKVSIQGVTVFANLELACSQGINVIIGENGTGKTHVLKCAYALLRAAEDAGASRQMTSGDDKLARVLAGRFRSSFASEDDTSRVTVECGSASFERVEPAGGVPFWSPPPPVRVRALFLPSREALAMYSGFVRAYENRELAFDETYYDLCKELGQLELREPQPEFAAVLQELEGIIGGPVRLDVETFVVETRRGPIAAPMIAEGHRKLAALAYLIKNGALTAESVLFWDEPEANLNPRLVTVVARVIRQLASAGVQIFVATHDFLLARELSMAAEYRTAPAVDTVFFALHRASDDGPVEAEPSGDWSHLEHNPIVEEYAAHYERAQALFAGEGAEGRP
jgi:energy-coupling factor transporter ATP-binding protein EcfA2